MEGELIITKVLPNFNIPNDRYLVLANNTGLINKSYSIINSEGIPMYFLQKIDTTVFKNVEGIMANICLITEQFKLLTDAPPYLEVVKTSSNVAYYKTIEGDYWRLYNYYQGKSYNNAVDTAMAATAGSAFGQFLKSLERVDIEELCYTIPQFHDIHLRYTQYKDSLTTASRDRINSAQPLLKLIDSEIAKWLSYYDQLRSSCDLKVTHNDSKLSNLIIADDGSTIVVDYDTVMPGYIALDFGDSVRTICSTVVEDDKKLERVDYNLDLLDSFAKAFVDALAPTTDSPDLRFMAEATCYMPFLMGLRMLTDYLNNDIYFSIDYSNHNLDRARNQFMLYSKGIEKLDLINSIININNEPQKT